MFPRTSGRGLITLWTTSSANFIFGQVQVRHRLTLQMYRMQRPLATEVRLLLQGLCQRQGQDRPGRCHLYPYRHQRCMKTAIIGFIGTRVAVTFIRHDQRLRWSPAPYAQSELLTRTFQTSRLTATDTRSTTRSKGNDALLMRYGDLGRVSALGFLEHHVILNNHVNSETY